MRTTSAQRRQTIPNGSQTDRDKGTNPDDLKGDPADVRADIPPNGILNRGYIKTPKIP